MKTLLIALAVTMLAMQVWLSLQSAPDPLLLRLQRDVPKHARAMQMTYEICRYIKDQDISRQRMARLSLGTEDRTTLRKQTALLTRRYQTAHDARLLDSEARQLKELFSECAAKLASPTVETVSHGHAQPSKP